MLILLESTFQAQQIHVAMDLTVVSSEALYMILPYDYPRALVVKLFCRYIGG